MKLSPRRHHRLISWDFRQGCAVACLMLAGVLHAAAQTSLLDPSFDPGTGSHGIINAIACQGDGRVLVAGSFTAFNESPRGRIARLNLDGSVDSSFDPGAGAD